MAVADDARPREVRPAIVAGKPANKAGLTAAEPMERRAGAEGNAGQLQSTVRTQSRATVSQALDRIRKQRGTGRGTVHRAAAPRRRGLVGASLRMAQAGAAPGVDGMTGRNTATIWPIGLRICTTAYTVAHTVHSRRCGLHLEIRRPAAAARHRGTGGQDRPARGGGGAQRNLRGGLPRLLLRVSTRAWAARRAGRARGWHRDQAVNWILDADIRSFLRQHRPRLDGALRRAPDR